MEDIKTADTSMVAIKMVDIRMADTTKMVASQETTVADITMMEGTMLKMDDSQTVDSKIVASMAFDDLLPLMRAKQHGLLSLSNASRANQAHLRQHRLSRALERARTTPWIVELSLT